MPQLTSTKKPSVLSKRITAAGFSAVAAAAFMFSAGSAQAGPKELAAIEAKLPSTVDIVGNAKKGTTTATFDQLQEALEAVLADAKYDKLVLGALVGELLKAPGSINEDTIDVGQAIYQAIQNEAALTSTLSKVLGDAAKTAATGKGANPSLVDSFVSSVVDSGDKDAVYAAAALARSSKTAVAGILAGYASASGVDPLQVAKDALANPKLAGAVLEISREVGGVAADPVAFTTGLAGSLTTKQLPLTLKIAPGVVASNPEEAGEITEALLGNATLKPVVVKGLASYAKAVSAVADIEEISQVGAHLARQIGANAAKTSLAAGLAKTLASAIFSKPTPTQAANGYDLNSPIGALTAKNRADEIAEVAAYVVGGIFNNTALAAKDYKSLNGTVLGVIKGAIAGAANKKLKDVTAAFAAVRSNMIVDIVGSVAATLDTYFDNIALTNQTLADKLRSGIDAYLAKSVKSIAGKDTALQGQVKDIVQIALGIKEDTADVVAKLENGHISNPIGDDVGSLYDPETDNKNF